MINKWTKFYFFIQNNNNFEFNNSNKKQGETILVSWLEDVLLACSLIRNLATDWIKSESGLCLRRFLSHRRRGLLGGQCCYILLTFDLPIVLTLAFIRDLAPIWFVVGCYILTVVTVVVIPTTTAATTTTTMALKKQEPFHKLVPLSHCHKVHL